MPLEQLGQAAAIMALRHLFQNSLQLSTLRVGKAADEFRAQLLLQHKIR